MTVFYKMHGLGNDFMVLDARSHPISLPATQIQALADRHRGVGFDQLAIINKSTSAADAAVQFFNADGDEVKACGNATRCVAYLLCEEMSKTHVLIDGPAGPLECEQAEGGEITADMGAPEFGWADIPLSDAMDTNALSLPSAPPGTAALGDPAAVNVGNPHCVFFVEDAEAVDLETIGPAMERNALFPERTNVGLVSVMAHPHDGEQGLRLRVWERGIGITQACGSGACAAAVAAARRGLSPRHVRVQLDGGYLSINWRTSDDHILMTGPAVMSYRGEIDLASFDISGSPS